jgi:hypothetical protein
MTWRLVVSVLAAAVCFAVAPVGVATADCSGAGDFGASSGCPPPGGSDSGGGDSWPPTSVDWPPGGDSGADGSDQGSGASPSKAPTPIVLPLGQEAPPVSTSETPTPIVAVGAPPLP